jgi:16S rRNA processing protein RimM
MSARKVRIGKIVGCHGVRGDIKIRPTSDQADWPETVRQIYLRNPNEATEKTLMLTDVRWHGPLLLARLEGFNNRNEVEPLVGSTLFADLSDLPEPEEGEYWADDIIGLAVVDAQTGRQRGKVKDLLSSGGSDFLEIQLEEAKDTVIIPFIDRFFPEVNLAARTISVDLLSDFLSLANTPVTADRLQQ